MREQKVKQNTKKEIQIVLTNIIYNSKKQYNFLENKLEIQLNKPNSTEKFAFDEPN